jgi:outer membrane protein
MARATRRVLLACLVATATGKKRQDMLQSERALAQARNSVAETASQVALDVNSSFRRLEDTRGFLRVARLARELAREKLRVVMNLYRQEKARLTDVVSAQAALGQAHDQYREAVLSVWSARAGFEKALGTDH